MTDLTDLTDLIEPTGQEVGDLAHTLWQKRGRGEGHAALDWQMAREFLVLKKNYTIVASHGSAAAAARRHAPGTETQPGAARACRFCGMAPPRTTFLDTPRALPEALGNPSVAAIDVCDACDAFFRRHLDGHAANLAASLEARFQGRPDAGVEFVPSAAHKALARAAVAVMPGDELGHFRATAEWVRNPNPAAGLLSPGTARCHVAWTPGPFPPGHVRVILMRRKDPRVGAPYMLFIVENGNLTFQTAVPLCDQDRRAGVAGPTASAFPRFPAGIGRGFAYGEPRWLSLDLAGGGPTSLQGVVGGSA